MKTLTVCLLSLPPSIFEGFACTSISLRQIADKQKSNANQFRYRRTCHIEIRFNIKHTLLFFIYLFRIEKQFLIWLKKLNHREHLISQSFFNVDLIIWYQQLKFWNQARYYNPLYKKYFLLSKLFFFDIQNYFYIIIPNNWCQEFDHYLKL